MAKKAGLCSLLGGLGSTLDCQGACWGGDAPERGGDAAEGVDDSGEG
jgi:hypothetical protein